MTAGDDGTTWIDARDLAIGAPGGGPVRQEAFRYAVGLPLARFAALAYAVFGPRATETRDGLARALDRLGGDAGYARFENDVDAMMVTLPGALVLAFPGTKSADNWGVNLAVDLVPVDGYDGAVRVHAGFARAWASARPTVLAFLADRMAARPRRIYLTGHSLGGAIATIATADLSNRPEHGIGAHVAACYTFGAPKVGTAAFDAYVRAPLYRVTQGIDVVPSLPFGLSPALLAALPHYRQGGDTRWFPPLASGEVLPRRRAPLFPVPHAILATLLRSWWTGRLDLIADHAVEGYVERMRAARALIDARRRAIGAP